MRIWDSVFRLKESDNSKWYGNCELLLTGCPRSLNNEKMFVLTECVKIDGEYSPGVFSIVVNEGELEKYFVQVE